MMTVAPFLGEFGWEVALWAPWLRWMQANIWKSTNLSVYCRPGHQALYRDFAHFVLDLDPHLEFTKIDCQNAWTQKDGILRKEDYAEIVKAAMKKRARTLITPHDLQVVWPKGRWLKGRCPIVKRALHHSPAARQSQPKLVLLHVRSCEQKIPERNWPVEHANEVRERLEGSGVHVLTIGSLAGAAALDQSPGHDLRGVPLDTLAGFLGDTVCVVGPSSGPMHFANQCLAPVLWWSGNEKDRERYESKWNPFGCANKQLGIRWNPPTVELITDHVLERIRG